MEEPLLSIVIVSYKNSSLVLRRAMHSVLEQSYKNYEIILVDANESGDDYSLGLREDMEAHPEIPVIACPSEKGELAAAKNQGAAQANGTYLAFLMGRDAWNQECASSQIEVLEEHPDVGLVFCHNWTQEEDALSTGYREAPEAGEGSADEDPLPPGDAIRSVSQVMFRRSVFEELLGFDTHIRRWDDYDMWIRLAGQHRIAAIDQALVCSYVDKDVLKKSRKLIDVVGYLQLYSKHHDFYRRNPAEKLELYQKIAACYKEEKCFFPWMRYAARVRMLELRVGKKRKKPSKEVKNMEPAYNVVSQRDKEFIAVVEYMDAGVNYAENPDERSEFQIWLKDAGSFDRAKSNERDTLVCNSEGYARSKALSQGVYVVHQTKGREGMRLAEDFEVTLNRSGMTHTIPVGGAPQEFYVKIVRKDMETGSAVPLAGGSYRIFDDAGKPVRMTVTYPEPVVLDCFSTGEKGYLVTPEKLRYGSYSVREDSAPHGYVRNGREVFFRVSEEHTVLENGVPLVVVEMDNVVQKGRIRIHKSGPVAMHVRLLENTETFSSDNFPEKDCMYVPEFTESGAANVAYEILAADDIMAADGTLRAEKGCVVDEIVTDASGNAVTGELYLGVYRIREKKAAYGLMREEDDPEVELTYAGDEISCTETEISFAGRRPKAYIHLEKKLGENGAFGVGGKEAFREFVFGLFAAQEFLSDDGTVIPEGGLLELLRCNEEGKAVSSAELPFGKYYVKELAAGPHYRRSDTLYPVEFLYTGQEEEEVHLSVNNGEPIDSIMIRGTIQGTAVDQYRYPIPEAQVAVFRADTADFAGDAALCTTAVDSDGRFSFPEIPCGDYVVKEISVPDGYLLNEAMYFVSLTFDGQRVDLKLISFHRG